MKKMFVYKRFRSESHAKIGTAIEIVEKYMAAGLRLTLRQLYYQFVAHHGLPNTERSYQNLGSLISDARLAGLIDWDAIEDRGRRPELPRQWKSISDLARIAIDQFRLPRWHDQDYYVELWVEKQALAGVLETVADEHHVPLMVNKGYSSQSAMYESANRFIANGRSKRQSILLYLGDHDPSGEDMVRDVRDRLELFGVDNLEVIKVALTMAQVEEHNPPPNPAKLTDSRAREYIEQHGDESWEVDALDPSTLVQLIEEQIEEYVDRELMDEVIANEEEQKKKLASLVAKAKW